MWIPNRTKTLYQYRHVVEQLHLRLSGQLGHQRPKTFIKWNFAFFLLDISLWDEISYKDVRPEIIAKQNTDREESRLTMDNDSWL